MERSTFLVAAALVIGGGIAAAQAPPRFEVASIRVNRDQSPTPTRLRPILQPGGRVTLRNQTLREIIRAAYVVNDNELVGGPDWINNTDFDIEARAAGDIQAETAQAMLRALLADRFALEVRRERR